MSYLDWHVGMEVVCIKRDGWDITSGVELEKTVNPSFGEICVIAVIDTSPMDGDTYIGIVGYPIFDRYHASRFRPVTKRSTDISIFTQLLISPKLPVDA